VANDAEFRWNEDNRDHTSTHRCTISEIESVVRNAGNGWPRKSGDGKYLVQGRGQGGRMIQVVYVVDEDGTFYVIHAMPLTTRRRRTLENANG
jgi:hypothetical protein